MIRSSFFLAIFLSCLLPLLASDDSPSITASRTSQPPVLDGRSDDPCWAMTTFQTLRTVGIGGEAVEFSIKAAVDAEHLYLLVICPDATESRRPASWGWNAERSVYMQKEGDEDCLAVLFFTPGAAGRGDLWIWRAARTDADGYADDLYFLPASLVPADGSPITDLAGLSIRDDSGTPCWKSRYYGSFVGNNLPRFQGEPHPAGSAADVRAKGCWESGSWTIEFMRRLSTGNEDDLDLAKIRAVAIAVARCGDGKSQEEATRLASGGLVIP